MAYVDEFNEDENEQSGAPLVPGSQTSNLQQVQSEGAPQGAKSKTPSRFADLGEYLRVNAPLQFGTKLAGKVGDDVTRGQSALDSAQTEFKNRADSQTLYDTQGLTGQLETDPEGLNPEEFQKLRDAEYKGPMDLSATPDLYHQVQGQAGSAVQKANASKSEGGRFALLNDYFGKPSYTQGQKTLDNLLVQNDPQAQNSFKQMQANAAQLQNNVNQAGGELADYGTQAKAATQNTRNTARTALGIDDSGNLTGQGAIGSTQGAITQAGNTRRSEAQRIQDAINSGKYSDVDNSMKDYFQSLDSTYKTDAKNFFTNTTPTSITDTDAASPEQVSRMRVLAQLGGMQDPYASAEGVGSEYGNNLFNFDKTGFEGQVQQGKQQFEAQKAPVMNKLAETENAADQFRREALAEGYRPEEFTYGTDEQGRKYIIDPNPNNQSYGKDQYKKFLNYQLIAETITNQLKDIYQDWGLNYATPMGGGSGGIAGGFRA